MSSEGVESYQQYLSSSASDGTLVTTSSTEAIGSRSGGAKDILSNNNNTTTNHFVVLPRSVDRSLQEYEGVGRGEPNFSSTTTATRSSSDVHNPLSVTPAVSAGTSNRLLHSHLIHNNNNNTITKLTTNHLSVKNLRDGVAPYSVGQKSSSGPSRSPQLQVTTEEALLGQENMYDSVMVSTLHVNSSSANTGPNRGGGLLIPSTSNHLLHNLHHSVSSKLEPNGNSVDGQLNNSSGLDGSSGDMMMISSNGGSFGSSTGSTGGDSVMMGLLHGNNLTSSGGPLAPSGSGHVMSSHGNGLSLSSPGGSLEDQDCDEEKVINGDTFSPGDVPDPDAIKMFVGQIPKHLSETELKTLFEEFGRVFQINVLRDKVSKQSKGCCFVTFYTRKAALDAQNALHNVKTLPGMNHPIQMKPADNENRYERKLFVGMLSKKCNESDVRNMFARFGHIDECTVLRDPQGTSRGCAFITFASKQCASSAIKALHHSLTMEGCSSPVVVKFADTQKDKDQKRTQQIHASIIPGFQAQPTSVNAISPQYFTLLQQLHQQQQQQQQQQSNSYFSSLSPLSGIATLASLATPSPGASLAGLTGSHSAGTNGDLAALAALANFTGVTSNQHSVALGIQAALAAALNGTHATLSQEYGYSTGAANGSSLGTANGGSLGLAASTYTGNGLQSAGLSSYTSALRASVTAASKQVNAEGPEGANLFIYHLPPEATDPDLISMFSPFGTVISAKVYIDKNTNRSKCFGFVSYDNAMSAQVAIQTMNGFQVGMKRLKVQLKRSKEAAKPY